MASASNSKTIYASASKTYGYDLKVSFNEGSTNISSNTSPISISGSMFGNHIGWSGSNKSKLELYWYDNNQNSNGKLVASKEFTSLSKNTTVSLTGSITVTHKNDGTLSGYTKLIFTRGGTSSYIPASTDLATANTTLTTIPRYGTSNQSLQSKTETSIVMNWSSNAMVDYVWYSTNGGGNWTAVGGVNGTSGSYTITGLTANATYNIKTRIRRKDSQLTTDSSNLSVATYDWPHVTTAPNFMIGNLLTISFYNPLSRSCKIYLILADGKEYGGDTINGTSIYGYATDDWQTNLYKSIPNSSSGLYKVRLVYGSRDTIVNGGTYTSPNNPPDVDFTMKDINQQTLDLTGDESIIVLNRSNVQIDITTLAKKYASVSTIYINGAKFNGDTSSVVINNSSTAIYTIRVVDSRGFENTKTIDLSEKCINYIPLTLNALFRRFKSTTGDVELNYSGNYYNGGFGLVDNQLELKYAYRKKGEADWSEFINLNPKIDTSTYSETLILDNKFDYQSIFEFIIFYKDKLTDLNISGTPNTIISAGKPIFWWNDNKVQMEKPLFLESGNQVLDYVVIDEWEEEDQ